MVLAADPGLCCAVYLLGHHLPGHARWCESGAPLPFQRLTVGGSRVIDPDLSCLAWRIVAGLPTGIANPGAHGLLFLHGWQRFVVAGVADHAVGTDGGHQFAHAIIRRLDGTVRASRRPP